MLIIDPRPEATGRLHRHLLDLDVDVMSTDDAADGLLQAGSLRPDAVLVAAEVPPMSGPSVARALHARCGIPAVIGVDKVDAAARRMAADSGAVAVVRRPYRLWEIVGVLSTLAPGSAVDLARTIEIGSLRLDPTSYDVVLRGHPIHLREREFALLHLMARHAGRVLSRRQIQELIWNGDEETSNTLSVHVKRLRAKLGDDLPEPRIIISVRGRGYRLEPPQ